MTFTSDETQYDDRSEENLEAELAKGARWYAVQVASGCEKRVKMNLEQRIETLDVVNRILEVQIPETPILKHQKDGRAKESAEKVFPGYVLVKMVMDDETWQVIKNTPNVINFVGAEQKRRYGRGRGHVKPMPLGHGEVERIFKQSQEQEPVRKIDMAMGDKITVLSGPFKDFEGEVIELSPERNKLKALLSIFGRETPVELEVNQVQKI
ncbi:MULTISPECIES: transcription termination/antitermination protein NusG [Leptolyngbya]|jgi:transcriptional antiterminator NusG|uniref:Transcription termination/antitermination protein NusG n=2 Tax=Leptolyngbya boryana TaxID=1184 RepID=A0A1Z4JHP6_LEPBY|nr:MULTISPECIES: transcription termination/antitermination protein NusG [Leptolyngbya]BAY56282.1 transcription termination/antitermination factor NusG [Leptolyngbya boryana NIES-2135]MBD1855810.1 transcription termination/antitermination protein NusG [Leptolyngbya sp. FACHB-1624]MBD2366388.1 transcription termination/antitermination protein NusG [Leptolyngbya sp. FACHB-161]MBD2372568.1 transcription termination/antitermination protein NusG [Leptolyngbya sp. FACHB-238]MBD2396991.1 transcription